MKNKQAEPQIMIRYLTQLLSGGDLSITARHAIGRHIGWLERQLEALEVIADCGQELVDILNDSSARSEIDSFTSDPMEISLLEWKQLSYDEIK